jgi:outer membrane protein assembly factor BamD (BamD/ComL family)
MTTSLISALLVVAAIVMGCSDKEAETKSKHRKLYESANASLDKAKAVEADLERAAEQQRQEIDRQTNE